MRFGMKITTDPGLRVRYFLLLNSEHISEKCAELCQKEKEEEKGERGKASNFPL